MTRLPALEQVADDTWVFALPMPPGHMPYTLNYALRDAEGGFHLIDAGWDTDENWSLLTTALGEMGCSVGEIRTVTATHLHPDHVGLASRIRAASGALLGLHALEQAAVDRGVGSAQGSDVGGWGCPDSVRPELERAALTSRAMTSPEFRSDVQLADGDALTIPGRDVRVLHTPGHTSGHICLVDERNGLLFTGDHLLPTVNPGIGLGGPSVDPIGDYLTSLSRAANFDAFEACPGHTHRFTGIADRCAVIAAHHLARTREVEGILEANPSATVWQIAEGLTWTAGWASLHELYLASALAQTAMHVAFLKSGRAAAQFAAWPGPAVG